MGPRKEENLWGLVGPDPQDTLPAILSCARHRKDCHLWLLALEHLTPLPLPQHWPALATPSHLLAIKALTCVIMPRAQHA